MTVDYVIKPIDADTLKVAYSSSGDVTIPVSNGCNCYDCACVTKDNTRYKYNEDTLLAEFSEYIKGTYNSHYVPDEEDLQALDVWDALGSMLTSCRDVALKYLWRIGRKGGYEDARKDIFKALHYCLLMLYSFDKQHNKELKT